ncbi:MAG: DUF4058 family protein [Phaeodactylibacter sp.]|nr:DUF4058 family protein [Phaeodactylibacter sp.]
MPSPFPGMDPYLEGHLWPESNLLLQMLISSPPFVLLKTPTASCPSSS